MEILSATLSHSQKETIAYILTDKCSVLCAGVAKLFLYSLLEKKWVYTETIGGLCLVIDREKAKKLFYIFDLIHFIPMFQFTCYNDFFDHYKELNDYFHYFEIPSSLIGFSFSHSTDAINFKTVLRKCFPSDLQQEAMSRNLINSRRKMKGDTYIDDEIRHAKFSGPINFQHCDHLGWDSINHCLDFNNISKELKQLLKEAGVKKKELRSKENALLVLGLLLSPLDVPEGGSPQKKQQKTKEQPGGKEIPLGSSKVNSNQNLPGMNRSMGSLIGQNNSSQSHPLKIGAPPPPQPSNNPSSVNEDKGGAKGPPEKPKMGTTIGKTFTVQEGLNIKTNLHSALDKRRAALMKGAANKRGDEENEQESSDSSWSE